MIKANIISCLKDSNNISKVDTRKVLFYNKWIYKPKSLDWSTWWSKLYWSWFIAGIRSKVLDL